MHGCDRAAAHRNNNAAKHSTTIKYYGASEPYVDQYLLDASRNESNNFSVSSFFCLRRPRTTDKSHVFQSAGKCNRENEFCYRQIDVLAFCSTTTAFVCARVIEPARSVPLVGWLVGCGHTTTDAAADCSYVSFPLWKTAPVSPSNQGLID